MERRRWLIWGVLAVLLLFLLLLPSLGVSKYWQHVLVMVGVAAVFGAGVRLIYIIGRLTLGHAAFLAIGAYTSALLATKLGVNFWFGLLLGGVAAGVVAIPLGYVVLRIAGIYFVIVTFAFAEFLRHLFTWWEPVTGGPTGVLGVPSPVIDIPGLPRVEFGINATPYFYLIIAIAAVSLFIMYRMERSRVGMAFHAVGQNPGLAEHLGINLTRYRVLAYVTACFFAGVVGAFQAHFHHYCSPDDFPVLESLYGQVYPFVGGIANPLGSSLGALTVIGLSEGLRMGKEFQPIFYGALLLVIILFLPRGLISLPALISSRVRKLRAQVAS